MTKKFFLLSLCIWIMFAGTGCRQHDKSSTTNLTLVILDDDSEKAGAKKFTRAFMNIHPGIKVTIRPVGGARYATKLASEVIANPIPPDIMWVADVFAADYAKRNISMDLSEFIRSDDDFTEDDYYSKMLDIFRVNGHLYALPRDLASVVMYYNRYHFVEYNQRASDEGKPELAFPHNGWTVAEFLDAAKKLTYKLRYGNREYQIWGYAASPKWQATRNYWFWQAGVELFNQDQTRCLLNTPAAKNIIDFIVLELPKKYRVTPPWDLPEGEPAGVNLFKTGRAAMCAHVRPLVPSLRDEDKRRRESDKFEIPLKWDVAPMPVGEEKVTVMGTSGYAMCRYTRHPDEAWLFMKFLLSRKGQSIFAESGGAVPVRKEVAESDVFLKSTPPEPEVNRLFYETAEYGRIVPLIHNFEKIDKVINQGFDNIYYNRETVDKACERMTVKINFLLGSGKK